jgi:hypothetical protein
MRPGVEQLRGTDHSDARLGQQPRREPAHARVELGLEIAGLGGQGKHATGGTAQGGDRGAMLDRLGRVAAQASTPDQQVVGRQRAELVAQALGRVDDQRLAGWLIAPVRACIARSRVVTSTRMASRSPRRRGWARCSRPSASRAARTASRSSVLAPPGARRAGGPVDLCHPLALLEQVGGEPSPVAAGALDRPHPAPWGLLDRESVDAQVAGGVGGTVWCAMAAPVGFTTAAVWVALWVSTPMMWSMVSASMGDAAFVAGWRCRRRPGEGDRVAGL